MRVVGKDPFESGLRIVGNNDVEHSARAGNGGVVAALDEAFPIGIKKGSVETEKANAKTTSALCSLRALIAEPNREWILRRGGSDDSIVE